MRRTLAVVPFAFLLIGSSSLAQPVDELSCDPVSVTGEYIEVSYPGAVRTQLADLNNRGDIIGTYDLSFDSGREAFLLRKGEWISLNVPGATTTVPLGINAGGAVVGYYQNGSDVAFLWEDGRFTRFQVDEHRTFFAGINASGTIAGSYYDETLNRYQAFILRRGELTLIGPTATELSGLARDINDRGEVLLNIYSSAAPSAPSTYMIATVRTSRPLETCAGGFWTDSTNQGALAGYLPTDTGPIGAVQLRDGRVVLLQYPGASGTYVMAAAESGRVVGSAQDVPELGRFVGFVFVPRP